MLIQNIVNTFFCSCTYVLTVDDFSWLVDCGDVEPLLSLLKGKNLKGVLLTHAHFDHIYGLNELLMHFPNVKVYTNGSGRESLLNDKMNLSRYHETSFVFEFPENIRIVDGGDEIALSKDFRAKVIVTPGHHPSCLTYVIDNAIFTGDSYIPGVKVVTNLPQGNKKQAHESVDCILSLSESGTIYPGHSS
ncbi:MAG: MBL fold metallo-hydrolase [Muribaculaceae bacterium]|nr:MBL fold metallo-hydrolase [Muribaculaceae bacterium]